MRVGVVGCGVAGQAAAILLADAGHAVTVFERFAEPRPIGAGLLLQPTGLAVLRDARPRRRGGGAGRARRRPRGQDAARPQRARSSLCRPASQGLRTGHPAQRAVRPAARTAAALAGEAGHRRGDRRCRAGLASSTSRAFAHGPFDLVVVADGAHSALRARPDARRPRADLSLGLHLDDRARSRRAGRRRPAAPARPRHDRDDGPAAGRAGADDDVLEPARRGAGAPAGRSTFRPGAARRGELWPEAAAHRRPRRRGRRLHARDLPPCRPAALERRVRCCSSATPRTAPARSSARAPISACSMPMRCSARCRKRRPRLGAGPVRQAPQLDRALLPPGQPPADAVLPVASWRRSAGCATPSWVWRATCPACGR